MKASNKTPKKLLLGVSCIALILTVMWIGLYLHGQHASRSNTGVPVTWIGLSGTTPIIGISSWRICGPFVVAGEDQRYSASSEARVFEKDYLKAMGGREAPLQLPTTLTHVSINFKLDPVKEPSDSSSPGVFLNQIQKFPRRGSQFATPLLGALPCFQGAVRGGGARIADRSRCCDFARNKLSN
jgi:hypothetical protein